MNNTGNILKAAAALVLAIIAGCSTVEYTTGKDTPTETFVRYTLDWEGQTEVPSELTVAMSRILHTVHFSCLMDSLGTMTSVLRDSTMTPCDTLTGLTMPNGEYYIIAFSSIPSTCTISGYDSFIYDNAASMRDILIKADAYTAEEAAGMSGGQTDFNPTQGYIKEMGHIWSDIIKANIHPDIDTIVTLTPKPLTQSLTFRIGIEAEAGVEIEKVEADISGVPPSVQLMTRHISDTLTCRVPFAMERKGALGSADYYEGSVCVPGVFPSVDPTYTTGAGILHIAIDAKADGHRRTFHASINLKQQLTDAGVVERTAENDRLYRTGVSEALIESGTKLKIEEHQIILDGNGQGVEVWEEKDDLEFEI